ncbi:hypothetical protein I9X38_00470 [Bacillus mojavensis]|nr:hypothetical protein I9X38_00470 [Bacillus mojavensis]
MLTALGFDSLDAMTAAVIPDSIKGTSVLGSHDGQSEADALAALKKKKKKIFSLTSVLICKLFYFIT